VIENSEIWTAIDRIRIIRIGNGDYAKTAVNINKVVIKLLGVHDIGLRYDVDNDLVFKTLYRGIVQRCSLYLAASRRQIASKCAP